MTPAGVRLAASKGRRSRQGPSLSLAERREKGFQEALAFAKKALEHGTGRITGPGRVTWPLAGRCTSPHLMSKSGSIEGFRGNRFMETVVAVRCRQCPACLRQKAREWAARGVREIGFWPRTYFGTLTLSPEEHVRALAEASVELAQDGVDVSTLTDHETFTYRTAQIGKWVTRYVKRCRKEMTGAQLRYVLVAEAHTSGLPHLHMLVHEAKPFSSDAWDTYCVLKSQWTHGHSAWEGVGHDPRAARYVTKYLHKSALARVRASARYGDPVSCVIRK